MIKNNLFALKKWFANEDEALSSFYQKKLSIHNPILVRYAIKNFEAQILQNKLQVLDKTLILKERNILIYKKFASNNCHTKIYLLTNIGVLIAHLINKDQEIFTITDILLETTPGRIIFSLNFKNLMK